MKDFFAHHTARGLIIPFVAVICVLLAGAGSARAANAFVEVGFVGVPPPGFQNVLLNVQRIRINPDATAAPDNGRWQGIPVPPGIGGSGQNAELQIDLNTSQNIPQLFNTAGVRPDTYKIAELILDPGNPGTLIPNCPTGTPLGRTTDGCINYPIQLAAGTSVISVTDTSPGGLIAPKGGIVTPLVLQVTMKINQAPTAPGGAYTVTVTLATLPKTVLGTIAGSVTVSGPGSGTAPTTKVRSLAVTAQAIGTNTPIATALVQNNKYTLVLPAAGGNNASESGFGTLYDLAVAGGYDTYSADRLVPLYPGGLIKGEDFTVTGSQTLGSISGTISDNCVAGKVISGATLQLLIPPQSAPSPLPTPAADYCISNPAQCVTVATATTDNTGSFPMPGTLTVPAEFDNVPMRTKDHPYAMEITAPGYDPLIVEAIPGSGTKAGTCECPASATPPYPCTASTIFTACNLALNTGYLSGSVPIIPPISGQTTLVQVFAEDHGTNTIESALPAPVTVTSSNSGSVPFTLNVPTSSSVPGGFDLFATTIDFYQGVVDPYQGHTIAVLSDVPAPPGPPTPHACSTASADFGQSIDCIGHGSVTGSVANPNLGTSVVLSKEDLVSGDFVQIASALVQNQAPNSSPSNNYAFCAPADTYWLQTVQMPVPEPSVTPSVAPTPEPTGAPTVSVTIPPPPLINGPTPTASGGPTPTASPTPTIKCPTTCQNPDGSCPGICSTVIQPL